MRGQDIQATLEHDAGAIARCSYCGRYTDDRAVLWINWTQCSCGKTHGWCGSFKPPTESSEWSTHNSALDKSHLPNTAETSRRRLEPMLVAADAKHTETKRKGEHATR